MKKQPPFEWLLWWDGEESNLMVLVSWMLKKVTMAPQTGRIPTFLCFDSKRLGLNHESNLKCFAL
ncbi:MAG: hypothetical protein IJX51_02115 [Clostridia bacterium]|nr:hypothetical protein [Clostridia bacterium]